MRSIPSRVYSRFRSLCLGVVMTSDNFLLPMKEEDNKRNKLISLQFKQKIKKKPYSEQIGNTLYTYSLLNKKNQVFFLSNERLLVLVGHRSIAYARALPETTTLPFYRQDNLPEFKFNLLLSAISTVTVQGDNLLIQFQTQSKIAPWEFVCDSKQVAQEWKETILEAMRVFWISEANQPIAVNLSHQIANLADRGARFPPAREEPKITVGINGLQPLPVTSNLFQTFQKPTKPAAESQPEKEFLPEFIIPATLGLAGQILSQTKSSITDKREYSPNIPRQQPQTSGNKPQIVSDIIHVTNYATEYQSKKKAEGKELLLIEEKEREMPEQKQFSPLANWSEKGSRVDVLADCHWDYQFAKGDEEYVVIERFKHYIEPIAAKIIQEQALKPNLREYRPVETTKEVIRYSLEGVDLSLSLLQLAEVSSFNDNSTIISAKSSKKARGEFKNTNYILQCTRNKGRFRVPLMMIVSYKGYQILAKSRVHSSPEYSSAISSLHQEINQLEGDTRVSRDLFEDQQNLKVVAADSRWFQKLSRAENKTKLFDCCFLTDIQYFIPQDLNSTLKDSHLQLRTELLQDQSLDGLLLSGGNLSGTLARTRVNAQTKQAINLLTQVSATIPSRTASLVEDIQNLDCVLTNSEQLSTLMHDSGLNLRYLGNLLDLVKAPWLSSILHSEIIARAAKHILRYELQESINFGVDTLQQAEEFQVGVVVNWLNRIMGVGPDSEGLWRQIIRQAQHSFRATVSRDRINIGFFLQALQHHGSFRLRAGLRKSAYFRSNNNFQKSDFLKFTLKSTVLDLDFTDHFSTLRGRLDTLSFQNYQYLSAMLNIDKRSSLESYYFFNGTGNDLMTYLANWLSPQQAAFLYPPLKDTLPNRTLYQLQLTAVKWQLKACRLPQAEQIRDQLIQHINFWLGPSHPILTELYDLLARYFLASQDVPGPALGHYRSALLNQEQLLGANHFKIADSYFALGEAQLHYSRLGQALLSFKKTLQIIEDNSQTLSQAYQEANFKMGVVLLLVNSVEEAIGYARNALSLSQQLNLNEKYIEAAQLLAQCYEVTERWEQYSRLQQQLISALSLYSNSLPHFQAILKIIFFPSLRSVGLRNSQTAQNLLSLLRTMPDLPVEQQQAHHFLRGKIEQRSFPWSLVDDLEAAEVLVREIESNGLARRWRGFDATGRQPRGLEFLGQLEALRLVIGRGFLEGLLDGQ